MANQIQNTEKAFKELTDKLQTAYGSQTQDVQKDFLNDLIAIREALFTDLSNLSEEGGDEENKKLKEENARLSYRIQILTGHLADKLNNSKIKELQNENERLQYNIAHLRTIVKEKVINN